MKTVAGVLGVSRSNLHERLHGSAKPRRSYHKAQDAAVLPRIERLVAKRPTYGYTAKDTRIFARQLGLKPCFTPVASPQSNGMSEAFVKTLKRDYVRVNPLPDAENVLRLIGDWIEDYNDNHPHSGLKWRSPREFIKAKTETA